MIRAPITDDEALAWWREAIALPAYERVGIPDCPEAGFFARRLCKGGPYVPARIWLEQETDETGELVDQPRLLCEVNGEPADAEAAWSYLCGMPITQEYFNYLTARNGWAAWHAPAEAAANPRKPIDWQTMPAPQF